MTAWLLLWSSIALLPSASALELDASFLNASQAVSVSRARMATPASQGPICPKASPLDRATFSLEYSDESGSLSTLRFRLGECKATDRADGSTRYLWTYRGVEGYVLFLDYAKNEPGKINLLAIPDPAATDGTRPKSVYFEIMGILPYTPEMLPSVIRVGEVKLESYADSSQKWTSPVIIRIKIAREAPLER